MRTSKIPVQILKSIFQPYPCVEIDDDGDISIYLYGHYWDNRGYSFKDFEGSCSSFKQLLEIISIIQNHQDIRGLYEDEFDNWHNDDCYGSLDDFCITIRQK